MVTRANKRFGMGLALMALSVGALLVVDLTSSLAPAEADAGSSLTEPVPMISAEDRPKGLLNRIGWAHAKRRLKADMPIGRGIPVGQVEGSIETGYIGNTEHPNLPGTGFIPESGRSKVNGHATAVATYIAGPRAAGQGVRAIHAWTVNDWMGSGYLNTGTTDNPRDDHPARVFNHSWIGRNAGNAPFVLRRIDYAIDTHDILVVCGVDNKKGQIPDLLASAYNVISVGANWGESSDALTHVEGEGRCKPEIVAPGDKTSWTTGILTGVCAVLLEYADRLAEADDKNKDAAKSEVIKAVLFAGARRPGHRWAPPEGEPLDRSMGAGVVELDRSLVLLDGGLAAPDQPTRQRYGWSFATIDAGKARTYAFTVDVEQGEAGIALVWHRKVRGGKVNLVNRDTGEKKEIWNPSTFVPDLNLGLVKTDADGGETLIAASTSKVDNVELIHLPKLDPGQYTLRITRANDDTELAWDYAVAWRIEARAE